ncbi:MAG TPA: hypothetical protein VIJ57_15325 [Hanamia sp.]
MKRVITLTMAIASLLVLSQITSCKKADPTPTTSYSIEGLWIGTYTDDQNSKSGAQYFSFVIKPDGTMIVDSKVDGQQYLAVGNWALNGSGFTASYTYVYGSTSATNVGTSQSVTATWNNKEKISSGIWKNVIPSNGETGTFTMTKTN